MSAVLRRVAASVHGAVDPEGLRADGARVAVIRLTDGRLAGDVLL